MPVTGYRKLDTTGNDASWKVFAGVNRMLSELFTKFAGAFDATFASVTVSGLTTTATAKLGTGTKTASATAGAATLNKPSGKITSEDLTTAAGATYTLTITNSTIAAADVAFASLANGTNTQGQPMIESVTAGAGSLVVVIRNRHASEALNGTLVVSFMSLKA